MDNEKEISFGAFDSELMHQEIYIPEGFEATIDGNKIILKKIESEDERIRKELIEHVKDQQSSFISAPDCRDKYEEEENNKYNSWLSWLEKQGTYTKRDVDNAYVEGMAFAKDELEKQKYAWSEEDENGLGDALWCCKQAASIAKDENDMGNVWYAEHWLKSLKDRYTWKPSDKQMHAFEQVYDWYNNNFAPSETLTSLYKDLEKLKGE